jgi:hypothetical protein
VVRVTGRAQCWGTDGFGQLGNGSASGSSLSPVTFVLTPPPGGGNPFPLPAIRGLATGVTFACALRLNGVPNCWGNNDAGQLGGGIPVGGISQVALPVPSFGVNVAPVAEVSSQGRRVSVTALVDCPEGATVRIRIDLEQGAAHGDGRVTKRCVGQLAEYVVWVVAREGTRFAEGPAEATATARVLTRGQLVDEQIWTRRITLEPGQAA